MLLFLLACAKNPTPTAPTPEPAAAPADGLAPRLFDAAALRDGFVLGTKLRMRIEAAGAPVIEEEWTVVGHTPDGCTIRTVSRDTEGTVLKEEEGTSTWAELEEHASFPAADTLVSDDQTTTPAGTFETRRYVVKDPDGTTRVMHFAKSFPGPPVRMEITKNGALVLSMTMLARTAP